LILWVINLKGWAYVDGTDEVTILREEMCKYETKQNSEEPSAGEAFDGLLGGELDERGAAEGDAADVCPDIVCDDQGDGQEEPDHALEDVVHDEVGLHNDEVERHVRPGELGELELVVAFLEGGDEEDEAFGGGGGGLVSWFSFDSWSLCGVDSPITYSMKLMKRWCVANGNRTWSTSMMCLK